MSKKSKSKVVDEHKVVDVVAEPEAAEPAPSKPEIEPAEPVSLTPSYEGQALVETNRAALLRMGQRKD